ncbi:hypothetical protein BC829DRAFT_441105 [Chytridium lagenaria]|nr:hypothetical protein BC829DRAFT_441105 [Chytridium lagenaria]
MGLLQTARGFSHNWIRKTPVECYPLILAVLSGIIYGIYVGSKKLAYDPDLRIRSGGGTEWDRWTKRVERTEGGEAVERGWRVKDGGA